MSRKGIPRFEQETAPANVVTEDRHATALRLAGRTYLSNSCKDQSWPVEAVYVATKKRVLHVSKISQFETCVAQHLFRSLQNHLNGETFDSDQAAKIELHQGFASKN